MTKEYSTSELQELLDCINFAEQVRAREVTLIRPVLIAVARSTNQVLEQFSVRDYRYEVKDIGSGWNLYIKEFGNDREDKKGEPD